MQSFENYYASSLSILRYGWITSFSGWYPSLSFIWISFCKAIVLNGSGNTGALRSMFDYHEVCVYVSSYHSDLRRIH